MIPWAHVNPRPKQHLDRLSHFCTDDCRVSSPYFTMGCPLFPLKIGNVERHLIHGCRFNMVPWAHPSPQPKWHLNRFSRFCRAHYCDWPTNRPTDHDTRSVTLGRIYKHSTAMQPNNTIIYNVHSAKEISHWRCGTYYYHVHLLSTLWINFRKDHSNKYITIAMGVS